MTCAPADPVKSIKSAAALMNNKQKMFLRKD